jgi:hypothetical protein
MLLQDGFVHRAGDSNRVTEINFVLDGCKTLNGRLRQLEMRERLDARRVRPRVGTVPRDSVCETQESLRILREHQGEHRPRRESLDLEKPRLGARVAREVLSFEQEARTAR